jgi:hypothetical protein
VKFRRALFAPFLCLVSCALSQYQPTQEATLPSGRKIKVIAEGELKFRDGTVGLILKYQTDLKISDSAALRKEADEIWVVLKQDAERLKLKSAIISANEMPNGMIGKGYNFVFEKQGDGSWRCPDDEPKQKPPKQEKK